MLKAKDIMTTDVQSVGPETELEELSKLFIAQDKQALYRLRSTEVSAETKIRSAHDLLELGRERLQVALFGAPLDESGRRSGVRADLGVILSDPRQAAVSSDDYTSNTLVVENADKRVLVPTRSISNNWKSTPSFNDSSWMVCRYKFNLLCLLGIS